MGDFKSDTIKRIINTLPFFIKNKNNLDRILEPINALYANETQAVVNSLISQYDHSLPYNYLTNETELQSLVPLVANADNNLVLNIRQKYGENVARYIFGYKPMYTDSTQHRYYLFSEVVPTIKMESISDYVYTDASCYDKYIFPSELRVIATSGDEMLLSMPIILKHWASLIEYMSDSQTLKKILLEHLKRLNCMNYYNMLDRLAPNYYSRPNLELEDLGQRESFMCLLAYFLEENYRVIGKQLNNSEIGFLLYKIVGETDLTGLNVKLPPIKEVSMVETTNKVLKQAQFKDTNDFFAPPIPPPLPGSGPLPWSMNTNDTPFKSADKTILIEDGENPDSERILNEMKELVEEQNAATRKANKNKYQDEKKGIIDELTKYIKTRFTGGDSFTYNEEDDDIRTVDCGAFPDNELEFLKITVPRLNKSLHIKLSNVDELKYRLFSNAKFGNYLNDLVFKKKISELFDILKRNKHLFLEYRFKEYDTDCFIVLDNKGIDSLKAFRLYFEMLKGLMFYMNETSSGSIASIPRENLMYIGISIITALNNFGYYIFGDLIAFRNYIDNFYTLVKRINAERVPIVSLYSSIYSTIHDFLDKTRIFVGGSQDLKVYDYFPYFNFFKHVYILDIISSHKHETIKDVRYLSETLNSKPIDVFWDGISYEKLYKNMSDEKKYLYSVMYETFFINNQLDGSVFKTEYNSNFTSLSHNDRYTPRVVFLANEVSDNLSFYTLLRNLSNRVSQDLSKEIDVQTLTMELEKIFGNNVIRNTDKLKIIKNPSQIPAFIKVINDNSGKLNLDSATMLETILFFFVILEKLGFTVQKTFAKTNMTVLIQPALLRENIAKELKKYPESSSELNQEFLSKYGEQLEHLFNASGVEIVAGADIDKRNATELVVTLPKPEFNMNVNITEDNIEKMFSDKDGFLANEIEDFEAGINLMLNANYVNEDVLYRMVPYYIKEQIKFVSSYPSENDFGGAQNKTDVIDLFLEKAQNISYQQVDDTSLSEEEISKLIDKFLKEKYVQSMDRIIPFYDNQISVGNGKDRSFLLLKYTLDTINYMRSHMKIDLDQSIKTGIYDIIKLKQETDEYCYKIFVLIKYIRLMIEELYNKLKIQPENKTLSFNEFSAFFNIINKKLQSRNEKYQRIVDEKTGDYIKAKLGTNYLRDASKNVNFDFMKLFDPKYSKEHTVIDMSNGSVTNRSTNNSTNNTSNRTGSDGNVVQGNRYIPVNRNAPESMDHKVPPLIDFFENGNNTESTV